MLQIIAFHVFRATSRFGFTWLAAFLLILVARPLGPSVQAGRRPKKLARILILAKDGFVDDVRASLLASEGFFVLSVPRIVFKGLAAGVLSPKLDDYYYRTDDPAIEASKFLYREFLQKTFQHVSRLRPIDAVMSGNFGYFAERELAHALEAEGTPFIVLHKENLKSPGRIKFFHAVYKDRRGKFRGRRILVYNEIERCLQVNSGVATADQIFVTGMPRLDRIHAWRRQNADTVSPPQLLFFSFSRNTGLPRLPRKPAAGVPHNQEGIESEIGALNWNILASECHRAMIRLAQARQDCRVLIKTKGTARDYKHAFSLLASPSSELPQNLRVVIGGDPFDALIASRVVIGLNTTGLLEALAAGKPVIVPWFAEATNTLHQEFVIDLGQAVQYANSPDQLIELALSYLDNPPAVPNELSMHSKAALQFWVGNADGNSATRIRQAVRDELHF